MMTEFLGGLVTGLVFGGLIGAITCLLVVENRPPTEEGTYE
jgi:hypothetical protein